MQLKCLESYYYKDANSVVLVGGLGVVPEKSALLTVCQVLMTLWVWTILSRESLQTLFNGLDLMAKGRQLKIFLLGE